MIARGKILIKRTNENLEKGYNFYLERFDEVWEKEKSNVKILEFRRIK